MKAPFTPIVFVAAVIAVIVPVATRGSAGRTLSILTCAGQYKHTNLALSRATRAEQARVEDN